MRKQSNFPQNGKERKLEMVVVVVNAHISRSLFEFLLQIRGDVLYTFNNNNSVFPLFQESPGPCSAGRYFAYNSTSGQTECACFKNFVEGGGGGPKAPCVELHTRAHCPEGQLVVASGSGGSARCACGPEDTPAHFWAADGRCYTHYARGPCAEGEQFRPHPATGRPACIQWGRTSPNGGYRRRRRRRKIVLR